MKAPGSFYIQLLSPAPHSIIIVSLMELAV